MTYNIVWFKLALRVHDHAPLLQASRTVPVLFLYIVEPSMWTVADATTQHYQFLRESLIDLDTALRKRGGGLRIEIGEALDVLDRLWREAPFMQLCVRYQMNGGPSRGACQETATKMRR